MAWEIQLFAQNAHFPSTNFATLDTRNNRPILNFDDTTDESAYFNILLPADYGGNGLTCTVGYSHSATSGNVDTNLAIERIGDQQLDTDTDSFATDNVTDNVTVPSTSGNVDVVTITFNDGVDMDSLAAGEYGRVRLVFDSPGTATGDIEFHWLKITET